MLDAATDLLISRASFGRMKPARTARFIAFACVAT
jgi:hypothetical protein